PADRRPTARPRPCVRVARPAVARARPRDAPPAPPGPRPPTGPRDGDQHSEDVAALHPPPLRAPPARRPPASGGAPRPGPRTEGGDPPAPGLGRRGPRHVPRPRGPGRRRQE